MADYTNRRTPCPVCKGLVMRPVHGEPLGGLHICGRCGTPLVPSGPRQYREARVDDITALQAGERAELRILMRTIDGLRDYARQMVLRQLQSTQGLTPAGVN